MEIMDNFGLDVRARTKESFEHAMAIALAHTPSGKITGWCKHRNYGLVLFWANDVQQFKEQDVVPLPYEMGLETITSFCWGWLQSVNHKDFNLNNDWDKACDGDVQNVKAWRVYIEEWGKIGGSPYAAVAILPVWAWLGK